MIVAACLLLCLLTPVTGESGRGPETCVDPPETLTFDVLCTTSDYEIRNYTADVWAMTRIMYYRWPGWKRAYQRLAQYFAGDNLQGVTMNLTSPIITSVSEDAAGTRFLYFLLPEKFQGSPPTPNDSRVSLADAPNPLLFVRRFRGSPRTSQREAEALITSLTRDNQSFDPNQYYIISYPREPFTPGGCPREEGRGRRLHGRPGWSPWTTGRGSEDVAGIPESWRRPALGLPHVDPLEELFSTDPLAERGRFGGDEEERGLRWGRSDGGRPGDGRETGGRGQRKHGQRWGQRQSQGWGRHQDGRQDSHRGHQDGRQGHQDGRHGNQDDHHGNQNGRHGNQDGHLGDRGRGHHGDRGPGGSQDHGYHIYQGRRPGGRWGDKERRRDHIPHRPGPRSAQCQRNEVCFSVRGNPVCPDQPE